MGCILPHLNNYIIYYAIYICALFLNETKTNVDNVDDMFMFYCHDCFIICDLHHG